MEYENGVLTEAIIGCCYNNHSQLGPGGFQERIYANALKINLKQINLTSELEKEFKVLIEGDLIGTFRCDRVVENRLS